MQHCGYKRPCQNVFSRCPWHNLQDHPHKTKTCVWQFVGWDHMKVSICCLCKWGSVSPSWTYMFGLYISLLWWCGTWNICNGITMSYVPHLFLAFNLRDFFPNLGKHLQWITWRFTDINKWYRCISFPSHNSLPSLGIEKFTWSSWCESMFEHSDKSIRLLQEPNTSSPLRCWILDANPWCLGFD
jgi:hypothetical protein